MLLVYLGGISIRGFTITNPAYGVMVQGVVDDVTVSDDKFDTILTLTGWTNAIEVTPPCVGVLIPTQSESLGAS
jgi:hypothetical protein